MSEAEMQSLFNQFGKDNVEVIPPPPGPPIKAKLVEDKKENVQSPTLRATLTETTGPDESAMESFDGDTSNEVSSLCDMSGVSFLHSSESSNGPGPIGNDSMDQVFFAEKINESQVVNVSTSTSADGSVISYEVREASNPPGMEI